MNRFYKLGLALIILVISSYSFISDDGTNAHIKATFIYNFTRYIEWPAEYKKGTFIIGVLGETRMWQELTTMKQKKSRGNQPFQITKFASVNSVNRCHMIFVAESRSHELGLVVSKVKDFKTLIITEQSGLIEKGSGINFVINNNKQGFEINRSSIKEHGLSLSSNLVAFATVVK